MFPGKYSAVRVVATFDCNTFGHTSHSQVTFVYHHLVHSTPIATIEELRTKRRVLGGIVRFLLKKNLTIPLKPKIIDACFDNGYKRP